MNNESSSNADYTLPADTLKILAEFLREKQEREEKELASIEEKAGLNVEFEENWQLSQFWYSEKTKVIFTNICKGIISPLSEEYKIGLLSCPSIYSPIKAIHKNVVIFEYDKRFSSYGDDFIFYDFNEGVDSDCVQKFEKSFDLLIVDPPFLSEECIEKVSGIVKKLLKDDGKIIFCSGEVVEPWVTKFLSLKKCNFKPEHGRNLGNEFTSYANFDLDKLLETL